MCSAYLKSKVGFYSLTHIQIHIYISIPMNIMGSDICQDARKNVYKPKKTLENAPSMSPSVQ